jgi:hypothetical protein
MKIYLQRGAVRKNIQKAGVTGTNAVWIAASNLLNEAAFVLVIGLE